MAKENYRQKPHIPFLFHLFSLIYTKVLFIIIIMMIIKKMIIIIIDNDDDNYKLNIFLGRPSEIWVVCDKYFFFIANMYNTNT